MKIIFNKVTWYSKLAAVFVFFVFVPLVSFYLGSFYEQTKILERDTPVVIYEAPSQNIKNAKPVSDIPKTNPATSSKPVNNPPKIPAGVVCTMEAKLCPDGSYVGRTGPNCEFTPCPSN